MYATMIPKKIMIQNLSERQTETKRLIYIERKTERYREKNREKQRETERYREKRRHRERQKYRDIQRYRNIHTEIYRDIQRYTEIYR